MTLDLSSFVDSLSSQKPSHEALKPILKAVAQVGRKHPQRGEVADLVFRVITGINTAKVQEVIDGLDLDEVDVLMRYIYYGFEHPTESTSFSSLLFWHDRACQRGGVGSIVRVMTEH